MQRRRKILEEAFKEASRKMAVKLLEESLNLRKKEMKMQKEKIVLTFKGEHGFKLRSEFEILGVRYAVTDIENCLLGDDYEIETKIFLEEICSMECDNCSCACKVKPLLPTVYIRDIGKESRKVKLDDATMLQMGKPENMLRNMIYLVEGREFQVVDLTEEISNGAKTVILEDAWDLKKKSTGLFLEARFYTLTELEDILNDQGFKIVKRHNAKIGDYER